MKDTMTSSDGLSVGKAALGSVKNKASGKLVIQIKAVKGAEGYLVQYGTNKKFKKAGRKLTKKNKLTIRKLKKKKTYYIRVCAYRIDTNGRIVYGSYSKVKKVTIRK